MNKIHLLDKKITLYQPNEGFKTSQDAVLAAAACPAKGTDRVLDMGCGVGGIFLCLLWRETDLKITGIDVQPEYLSLAKENAALNGTDVTLLNHDAVHFRVNSPKDRFDHVVCNPPYFENEKHTPSPSEIKASARGYLNSENTLENWIKSALQNLKPRGSLTFIYPAEKLDQIIVFLNRRFGSTEIIPIYSKPDEAAKRIIIRSYKDRKGPCKVHRPVYMHLIDLKPTSTSHALLREGLSFDKIFEEQRVII